MVKKLHKCAYCKEEININDEEKYNVSKEEGKVCNRYFHKSKECLIKYIENEKIKAEEKLKAQKEYAEWDELYQYIKKEILKYDDRQKLSPYMVSRLQGLRNGNYGFRRNSKVFYSENGYEYKVILMCFKVKKIDIISSIKDASKFKNENHKVDYMMKIIGNSINDVYIRIIEKEQSNEKIKNMDLSKINTEINIEYKNKTNIKDNKVANKLKDLF